MKTKTELSGRDEYKARLKSLKRWVNVNEIQLAQNEFQFDPDEDNLLQLAIQYRDLPAISYLLSLNIFNKKTLIDDKTWNTINQSLKEDEEHFKEFQNKGFFHHNLLSLIHKRLDQEYQLGLIKKYGALGLLATPVILLLIYLRSPQAIKLISNAAQAVVYAVQSIRSKFFYKSSPPKEEVPLSPEQQFKKDYPTIETNKIKAKINKRTDRLYNYTSLGYAVAAGALTSFAYYAAPTLIKVGQAVASKAIGIGLGAISGILLAGAELWIARSFHQKVREDETNKVLDLKTIEDQITTLQNTQTKTLDTAIQLRTLEYRKLEITSYYDTQIAAHKRARNGALVGAGLFAVAALASLIPFTAPFAVPIMGVAFAGWVISKIVVAYQNHKTNAKEQQKLKAEQELLENDCAELRDSFEIAKEVQEAEAKLTDSLMIKPEVGEQPQAEPVAEPQPPEPVAELEATNQNTFVDPDQHTEEQIKPGM